MQEQRIVPDRLLKEEVTRAGLPNRYAGRHPDRHASGSIQERTALGLDPVVRLDSDSEIEDAARAIGRDARDGRSVGSETIGCLVDPLSLRAIESHLQRVRPRIAREGGAHFSGRLILEGAERLRAVVRSGQADPGADALGTELGRVPPAAHHAHAVRDDVEPARHLTAVPGPLGGGLRPGEQRVDRRRDHRRGGLSVGHRVRDDVHAVQVFARVAVRSQVLACASVTECLRRTSTLLYRSTDAGKFVTAFFCVLDPSRHELRFSNAGHNPPLLFRSGSGLERLETGGPVLGIFEATEFEEARCPLERGDLLVVYSDGISEAMNADGEEFGEAGIIAVVNQERHRDAGAVLHAIMEAAREFSGDRLQLDDMTMIVLHRT